VRLTTKEVQYLSLFGSVTGAFSKDCIVGRRTVIFVVGEGDMGQAIGKGGKNVKKLEEILGKKVELVEYSSDPAQFIRNVFSPANVEKVKDAKVRLARTLAARHFGIDNVVVA